MTSSIKSVRLILEATLGVILVALVVSSFIGQPLLLGYVETGSMAPTMDAGDGFIAVPSALAGPVEVGDVVVFRAEVINGGELTTHRVTDVTDHGYVTTGDANAFSDQSTGEPPVKRAQVVAEALQVGGEVVVIPSIGIVAEEVRGLLQSVQRTTALFFGTRALLGWKGLTYLFFGATVVWYLVGSWRDTDPTGRSYDRAGERDRESGTSPRFVLLVVAAILVAGASAGMLGASGQVEYGIASTPVNTPSIGTVPVGGSETTTYRVPNSGVIPVVVFLEPGSDRLQTESEMLRVPPNTQVNATLTIHAPPETGYYRRYVTEHRYLAVLPTSTIRTLYEIHPWLPVVVIDALLAGVFLGLTLPFVGRGRIRDRSRDGARRSVLTRLVR